MLAVIVGVVVVGMVHGGTEDVCPEFQEVGFPKVAFPLGMESFVFQVVQGNGGILVYTLDPTAKEMVVRIGSEGEALWKREESGVMGMDFDGEDRVIIAERDAEGGLRVRVVDDQTGEDEDDVQYDIGFIGKGTIDVFKMKKIGDDSILFAVSNGTVNGGSSVIDFLMYDVTESKLSTTRERLSGGTMDPKPTTALIFDINEQTFLLKYGNTNVRMKGGRFS